MTARFMFEGSKHSESKQETRGHRPRPQLRGFASSPWLAKYVVTLFGLRSGACGVGIGRLSIRIKCTHTIVVLCVPLKTGVRKAGHAAPHCAHLCKSGSVG